MKKIIVILLTAVLFISCSAVKKNEINMQKQYEILLNKWKLPELEILLEKNSGTEEAEITEKYKKLLQERKEDAKALEDMIQALKTQLESNNFENIEMYFDDTFVNRKILSELKNIDFSQMKIMYTKPKFYKNKAFNTGAVIFTDNVQYFRFSYKLSNRKWSIIEIKDGR